MRGGITSSSLSRRGGFAGTLFRLWSHSRVVFDVGMLMGFEVQDSIKVLGSEASAKLSMYSSSESEDEVSGSICLEVVELYSEYLVSHHYFIKLGNDSGGISSSSSSRRV